MRLFVVLALFSVASVAQQIFIFSPKAGANIVPGRSLTVEVDRPDSLTSTQEVAIAIGLLSCAGFPGGTCASIDVTQRLGAILYTGPYKPVSHGGVGLGQFYQNFTVKVPSDIPRGEASLSISHFSLIGGGPVPFFEVKNVTLKVV